MRLPGFGLLLLLILPGAAQQPALKTGMKLGDFYLHDPFILPHAESKTYYLYNAGSGRMMGMNRSGVVVYTSKDLETWEGPRVVFTVPDGMWANPQHGVWAPEVHEYRGKFYLFATLHNRDARIPEPPEEFLPVYQGAKARHHLRATQIFVSDSPLGPFERFGEDPRPPADYMTLDGTLFVEDGIPYMVYAHEWIQVLDGTMEAIQLKTDLSAAVGEPFHLFKATDAPWFRDETAASNQARVYVTDGPQLYRTKTGKLLMLWSSYREGLYVQTVAYSLTGKLRGPWRQGEPLVGDDSGHGMLFRSFDGRLMLVLHQPFRNARGKLYEMEDTGDGVRVKRQLVY